MPPVLASSFSASSNGDDSQRSGRPNYDEKSEDLGPKASTVALAAEQDDQWTASSLEAHELELIYSHLSDRSFDQWLAILRDAVTYHENDPLIVPQKYEFFRKLAEGPLPGQSDFEWHDLVAFEAFVIHEWSIYPEVRNVTTPIEEPGEDYQSLRVYVISSIWTLAGATVDTFFATRSPAITISTVALQILIAGSGHLWALLPRITMPVGFGKRVVINSGLPWSFKEQMLTTMGMTVAANNPYSQYVIITQGNQHFYNMQEAESFGYQITLTLSSAFMGFGFGGIFRSLLVYPSRMVWFSELSTLKISRVFSEKDIREHINGWKLKRGEFVLILGLIAFGWYWIVTNVLSFLSIFNWICYIAPQNVNANAMTGLTYGLGINPFPTFDFSYTNQYFPGIFVPVYAYANYMIGIIIGMIAVIIIWYTNVGNTGYFPIASQSIYDNTAQPYQVTEAVDSSTLAFDNNKYQQYSVPYWSAFTLTEYGAFFMVYPLGFVYAILNHFTELVQGFKTMARGLKFWNRDGQRSIDNFNDSFCRRQQKYAEVPEYVYLAVFAAAFGMAVGCVEGYAFTDTPVWTIVLGIGLAAVFVPITGILYAQTTYTFETNVLFELIIGLARESHNQTLLVSKCFATNFFAQTDNWISNQKIAHYSGISPWSMFSIQCLTTCLVSFVQVGIMTFQLNGGIYNMCDPENKDHFLCNNARSYFNASVVWGLIGPRRMFKVYPSMKWCFLIGAVIPLPLFAWRKLGPRLAAARKLDLQSWRGYIASGVFLEYINEMLVCTAAATQPALSRVGQSVLPDYYVHLLFQLFVRQKFPRWWTKYAYLVTPSLSIGTGWAAFFNFWATQYHHVVYLDAWTNNANDEVMDGTLTAVRKVLPDGDYFGLRRGTFS